MALSSRQAAPIVTLHGGPSLPSSYLYPLEKVVPYRSIVYYDQLGCGKSDTPNDVSLYSIEDSVNDLKQLIKHLGIRRFHLYGHSYGGILAFEYMKVVSRENKKNDVECLSAILSSAPSDIPQLEMQFVRLRE
jgi:proline-specific peptidase